MSTFPWTHTNGNNPWRNTERDLYWPGEVKGFFRTSVILNQSLEKYSQQAGPFKENILPSNHKKHENIKSSIREQLFFFF